MRILLVEDLPEMRATAQEILEALGHQTHAVTSGTEALNALAGGDGEFDALITDVQLPGMSGTQLLERLLARRTRLALLAISSSQSREDLDHLVAQGRVVFLRKPFSFQDLDRHLACAVLARDLPVAL